MGLMLHRHNTRTDDDDDEVPTALVGIVIVPAVLGAVAFAYGSVSAFDAAVGWNRGSGGGARGTTTLPI